MKTTEDDLIVIRTLMELVKGLKHICEHIKDEMPGDTFQVHVQPFDDGITFAQNALPHLKELFDKKIKENEIKNQGQ